MSSAPDKTSAGREAPNDGPPGAAERPTGAAGYPSDTLPSTEGLGRAGAASVRVEREAAYAAVRSVVSQLGDHLPVAPVARDAIIWLAVENALDAHDAAMVRERHRRIDVLTRAAYEDGKVDGRVEGRRQATEDAYDTAPADLGDGYHELELGHGRWYHLDDLGARAMVELRRPYTLLRWKRLVGPWEPTEQPAGERDIESYCHRCHGPNTPWSAPSPLWNAVMRGGSIVNQDEFDGIVCPTCFALLAEERGIAQLWWLSAQRVHVELETVTPSGRTYDEATQRWRDAEPSEQAPCPTCSGPIRETVGMVCQTCGTDYAPTADPGPECPKSRRVDGLLHSWVFDGDDPRIVCAFCNEMRDALSGAVLREGDRA